MSITAAMVKELRERTGSGMMECKKALVQSKGDLEIAIEEMRKSGLAKADKKSGRIAAEGLISIKVSADEKTAVIVDINSETDFVAKGDDFLAFVDNVATTLLAAGKVETEEQLLALEIDGATIEHTRRELIAKLGENITIRRFQKFSSDKGSVSGYLHGSRIGVIVDLAKADAELGKDIAMHVAASKPICVNAEQVDPVLVEKEKAIFTAQALESGKPEAIIEKMITGRIKKYLAEVTLEGQAFIKDPDVSVGKLVASKDNSVINFCRFEVGEGIEKKEENFAEEVMAQVRG